MKSSTQHAFVAVVLLLLASGSALADIRIDLVKGKRTVRDKVSFTIEVTHEVNEDPGYKDRPEFIVVEGLKFASPASGMIALDGNGIQRFDETASVEGQRTEITYGRHVITLQVAEPAVVTSMVVLVRGGVVREVIGGSGEGAATNTGRPANISGEERLTALEQRVRQLEAEVEMLKSGRRNQ